MQELETIGWDHVESVDASMLAMTLHSTDASGYTHRLAITLSARYPAVAPQCSADLPTPIDIRWGPSSSLSTVYNVFEASLARYQPAWAVLRDIDSNAWVLEPTHPSKSCMFRRIALDDVVSVQVELNRRNPAAVPDCKLLGPDKSILPLREKFSRYCGMRSIKQSS